MARILAIDDEAEILLVIKRALEKEGHQVTTVTEVKSLKDSDLTRYDMMLLDVMMPEVDGFTFCREIRSKVDYPILFLTAKVMEEDMITGLNIGGDDYITKPFRIGELRARVQAHLRRENREKQNAFLRSGLRFCLQSKEIYSGEERIPFTKSEYEICEFLAVNHGQVFSKERIFEQVYGFDKDSDSSAITEHIKNIRNKLARFSAETIETVWGIGYRWRKD